MTRELYSVERDDRRAVDQ